MTSDAALAEFRPAPGTPAARRALARLFAISTLVLFLEIAHIRWLPGHIRVLAYFANVILISSFLGLGIGCMLAASRRCWLTVFPGAAPLLVVVTLGFERTNDPHTYGRVLAAVLGALALATIAGLWRLPARRAALALVAAAATLGAAAWAFDWQSGAALEALRSGVFAWGSGHRLALALAVVPVVFLLNGVMFVALGQELGRSFAATAPLPGYTANILGSLAGILLFSALSFGETPPTVWFALAYLLTLAFLWRRPRRAAAAVILLGATVAVLHEYQGLRTTWSPYSKVAVGPAGEYPHGGFALNVNDDYHQLALNLSDAALDEPAAPAGGAGMMRTWRRLYDAPYAVGPRPVRVLVVGAGTGNDVAAALRAGARHVDAVEIDPVIARLGREDHPERPYADPRVRQIVHDARGYLRHTDARYDRIVYGYLDSHALFSSMTSIRLDNFVYTREALAEARDRLTPAGVLAISFQTGQPWIARKLHDLLAEAFGAAPTALVSDLNYGTIFLIGPGLPADAPAAVPGTRPATLMTEGEVTLPTDDWPHLYVRNKGLSNHYIFMVTALLAVSVLACGAALRRNRRFSPFFALMGAAFLLLETKSITSLSLLFGATWITNAVVIAAILIAIVLANLAVARARDRIARHLRWVFLLIGATLALNYLVPPEALLFENPWWRALLAGGFVGLPIFGAAVVFAHYFDRADQLPAVLGSNLLGSVVGGLGEYSSLLFGYRSLYLAAALVYFLAYLLRPRPSG